MQYKKKNQGRIYTEVGQKETQFQEVKRIKVHSPNKQLTQHQKYLDIILKAKPKIKVKIHKSINNLSKLQLTMKTW